MSDNNKNLIITVAARRKLVKARAGAASLPKITGMAFGDGGVDSDGHVVAPTEDQATLTHELFRKVIDGYEVLADETATIRYECTLSADELVGAEVSEIGLYDAEGDIACIKTFPRKGKDDDEEHTYSIDDIF